MELLAPAGNMETLIAAIHAGCDAVYISGKNFGARKSAQNFTNEELKEAVEYAHLRNVKIYVTVNTLIYDEEFSELSPYLKFLEEIKVDALIVQDLGVIHFIRTNFPSLIVHASTQLNINSVSGALLLKKMGVKRVVLARETPIDIVKQIVDTGIEVEVFIHGALCFAYSGQCLMSFAIGKRSGNRGECAQPCRKKYRLIENGKYLTPYLSLLSMKDLNTLDYLDQLKEIGVESLKIEGRMKSPAYVMSVVKAYYNKLHQIPDDKMMDNLLVSFNREFTKGYMFNEDNASITNINSVNHQGLYIGKVTKVTNDGITLNLVKPLVINDAIRIKGKNEVGFYVTNLKQDNNNYYIKGNFKVSVNDLVYKTVDNALLVNAKTQEENENQIINLSATLFASLHKPLTLIVKYNDLVIKETLDVLDEKADKPLDIERIKTQLKKIGNPLFQFTNLEINYDNMAFIKVSMINEIRRRAIEKLKQPILDNYQLTKNDDYPYQDVKRKNQKGNDSIKIDIVLTKKSQLSFVKDLPFNKVYTLFKSEYEPYYFHCNRNFDSNAGLIHNLGDLNQGMSLSPSFNVLNSETIKLLDNFSLDTIYLSHELSIDEQMKLSRKTKSPNIGVFLYGRMELMSTAHCFINKVRKMKNLHCTLCEKNDYYIEDEYHNLMYVVSRCNKTRPETIIYNYKITDNFSFINNYLGNNIKRFLIVLTDENEIMLNKLKKKIKEVMDLDR